MTPEDLRASIPVFDDLTYMNFGATGPSPRPVVGAATSCLEQHAFDAASDEGMYPFVYDTYEDVRGTVADFVGADTEEIALTQSTADGINRFAGALPWESGDVVVRTDLEHPAGILPWERLERLEHVDVRIVPSEDGRLDLDGYEAAVDGATLVCVSALTWNYGTRLPVRELVEIAHAAGAKVLVDAVQWAGQVPLNVSHWGADAVAAAGHKWLLGPWGAGFLYIDQGLAERLEPGTIGYRSVADATASPYELGPGAKRFEIGTTNPAPHVGLQTAISQVERIGLDTIEERIRSLAGRLVDGLPDESVLSPSTPESGLVTVDVADPGATVEALRDEGFVLRAIPYPEALRASIHAVNTIEEVDRLAVALNRRIG